MYIDLDNRERARVRDGKQRRPILKTWTFCSALGKWEVVVATKGKVSGSKKKWTGTHTTFPP